MVFVSEKLLAKYHSVAFVADLSAKPPSRARCRVLSHDGLCAKFLEPETENIDM